MPVMTPAFTVYSDSPFGAPANQPSRQTQRAAAFPIIDTLRHDPPGAWMGNKYAQSEHYKSTTYTAINAIMDVIHCATVSVGRRKRSRNKSTLPAGNRLTK